MATKTKTKTKRIHVVDYSKITAAVLAALPQAAAAPQPIFRPHAVASTPVISALFGIAMGAALVAWAAAPRPTATAAPVTVAAATVDYAKITEAVKAALPQPAAPVAKAAPVKRKAAARPIVRPVVWYVAPHGCTCGL